MRPDLTPAEAKDEYISAGVVTDHYGITWDQLVEAQKVGIRPDFSIDLKPHYSLETIVRVKRWLRGEPVVVLGGK